MNQNTEINKILSGETKLSFSKVNYDTKQKTEELGQVLNQAKENMENSLKL